MAIPFEVVDIDQQVGKTTITIAVPNATGQKHTFVAAAEDAAAYTLGAFYTFAGVPQVDPTHPLATAPAAVSTATTVPASHPAVIHPAVAATPVSAAQPVPPAK